MTDFVYIAGPLNSTQTYAASSIIGGGTLLLLAICIFGCAALIVILTSLERYSKLIDTLYKLAHTLKYTAFGGGLAAIGYALYLLGNTISSVGKGIDPIWIAEAIGIYIGLTILGYIANRIYKKIKEMHMMYKNKGVVS
jgi:hypothetical protein